MIIGKSTKLGNDNKIFTLHLYFLLSSSFSTDGRRKVIDDYI